MIVEHVVPAGIDMDGETMFDQSLADLREPGDNYLRGELPYVHWYDAAGLRHEIGHAGLAVSLWASDAGLAGYALTHPSADA